MYSGITGKEFAADIYLGVVFYQRLRHMVLDKFQVRTTGPVDPVTQQPVKVSFQSLHFYALCCAVVSAGKPGLVPDLRSRPRKCKTIKTNADLSLRVANVPAVSASGKWSEMHSSRTARRFSSKTG